MTELLTAAAIPKAKPQKDWLSRKEAANYLTSKGCRITAKTLANMASNNNALKGPAFTRTSWKGVQYLRIDLDRWFDARAQRIA